MKMNLFKDSVDYFKKIAKVYHGSGDLNKAQTWLKDLINKLGVEVYCDNYNKKDKYGNIYCQIPATDNKLAPVILQAHYDMVIVTNDLAKMKKEGVDLVQENNTLHSRGYKTTIGADDCLGIAIMLAIIKNRNNFKHGKIKFLMTADEETAMLGAKACAKLHPEWFDYKYLINLDNTNLNFVYSGCYAGIENRMSKTFKTLKLKPQNIFEISISGLAGGHSAIINNKLANAIVLMAKLLLKLKNVQIISYDDCGQLAHNAIPRESKIIISCANSINEIKDIWNKFRFEDQFVSESNIVFDIRKLNNKYKNCLSNKDSLSLLNLIDSLPNGAFKKFFYILFYTTCNISPLFSFNTNGSSTTIRITSFVRTYVHEQIKKINNQVSQACKKYKFKLDETLVSPVWTKKENSKLQQAMIKATKTQGFKSISVPTPACIECCWFSQAIKHLDIVSIGDGIKDPHLPTETLELKPYKKLCDILFNFLQNFK